MNFTTDTTKRKEGFEPVEINMTFNSFDDLQLFYKMMDRYKCDIMPRGASGWSTWFDLYAFVKNHLIESLIRT